MHTASLTQGVEPQLNSLHRSAPQPRPTFGIACWLLAMLAFAQLITVGAALAVRSDQPVQRQMVMVVEAPMVIEPIAPRTVAQILADMSPAVPSASAAHGLLADHEPLIPAPMVPPMIPQVVPKVAPSRAVSVIANPRVERLVQESRNLYLEGDMMRAMLKLEEAGRIDPDECAVIYQKGILFEGMGIFTQAADQYVQIQQMGLVKAGRYYRMAADKLTKGMYTASSRRSTLAIGPMKLNKGSGADSARRAEIAVTLLARPDIAVLPDDVEVQVHFYDKVNGGDIKKAASNAEILSHWADAKVDWQDTGNEETLRVSYTIPQADLAEQHLLGRREFYGYVVELLYKGEVIDQQAHPRNLHSIHSGSKVPAYHDDLGMPWLPGDDNSLLPGKEETLDGYDSYAPLPSR